MKGFQLLSTVLREPWAVHESVSQAFMALIPALQEGKEVDFSQFSGKRKEKVSASGGDDFIDDDLIEYVDGDDCEEEEAPVETEAEPIEPEAKQYVAVISLIGVVMKYDTWCAYGSKTIGQAIATADKDPNVRGIVLNLDSPGGSVAGTEELAKIIAACEKPVVAYVDGMAASAAYWLAAQCRHIVVNGETSTIGSIGTMVTIIDTSGYYEKQGAKVYELYARTSPEKNAATRELAKGKDKTILDRLDQYDAIFMDAVKAGRGKLLNEEMTLKGQDYLSNDALKYGLVDSIGTLEDAVNMVGTLATQNKPSTGNNTPMGIFSKSLPAAVAALAGKPVSEISEQALDAANAALEAENIKGLELVKVEDVTSLQSAHDTLATANADLTSKLADANSKLATAQSELASANTRAEAAEAKAATYGAQPGAKPANPQSKATVEGGEPKADEFASSVDAEATELYNQINKK